MTGKNCLIVSLSTILVSTLVLASTTGGGNLYSPNYGWAGQGTYDPWLDVNDDGKIDVNDSIAVWQAYGTTGNPTKPVIINNKIQSYSFSKIIPPRSIESFNVSTAGYRQATIILRANNSIPNGSTTFYLEARTGFLIDKCYTFSEWFAVVETYKVIWTPPVPPLVKPQIWLEPTYIRIDNPNVGCKFNVTARVHEDFWHPLNVSAWQIYFEYPYNLEITRVFEPKWDPEYIFYNKTTSFLKAYPNAFGHKVGKNSFAAGALLYPSNQTPARGNGKLCIIEFSIKYLPKTGEQSWILNIDNEDTYLLDPKVNEIHMIKYNAVVQWGYDSIAKTIQIIGPILIVECYNHNENESIEASLEIYLTT